MKNLKDSILEKLIINKDIKMTSTGKDYWPDKEMFKSDMIKFVKQALKEMNLENAAKISIEQFKIIFMKL